MKRLLLFGFLGFCTALPTTGRAQEPEPVPVPPRPVPEMPPPPLILPPPLPFLTAGVIMGPCGGCERFIAVPRLMLVPEETAITVPKLTLREVEVGRDKVTRLDIDFRDERHTITEMVLKPHVVEQQVVVMTMKDETTVDPVTGKACTVRKECPVVQTVKVTVYDTEPVEREVIVRVPCLRPVEQDVLIRKLVVEETTEAAILRRYHEIFLPNELHVEIPPCPLCVPGSHE
jgi:hypothetical protein